MLRTGTFPSVVDAIGHTLHSVNEAGNETATGRLIMGSNTWM